VTDTTSNRFESDISPLDVEFSIQQASQLLNVPAPTIRSWERRYGIPVVSRSQGGHRRYRSDQLTTLRRLRDDIAGGRTAGAAAARVKERQSGPYDPRIEAFLAAVNRLDSVTVSQLLDSFTQTTGLARVLDEVLFPAMREVGLWWAEGRCDVAHEHLVTETSRAWLSRATRIRPVAGADPRPILLACGPADHHTLGLEAIGALLSQRGLACRLLGARTPAASLSMAVEATGAAAVIMVSHLPSARHAAVESLRGTPSSRIHVFYAGNAFQSVQSRRSVPGKYLGINLSQATDLVLTDITTAPHPAK
jgi:methanogenic corrinoid protein MtbC1